MMMRMLEAGGFSLLTDLSRPADADNPRGYYEYAPVKRLRDDASWLPAAHGKALKVISLLLETLPPDCQYRVIFMERELGEILASQRVMIARRAPEGIQPLAYKNPEQLDQEEDTRLKDTYEKHLRRIHEWMDSRENMRVLRLNYGHVVAEPRKTAREVATFLDRPMNEYAMAAAVEPLLRHQRNLMQTSQPNVSV